VAHRWGVDLKGKTVCVVGAGKVGREVIRLLVERQAVVVACDVDDDKAEGAVRSGCTHIIDPLEATGTYADILCPCELGGLLTEEVVPDLHVGIVVGAANNQLARAEVADALAAADILYVPDFLANAGGIINIAEEATGYDRTRALKAVGRIHDTTITVLERAEAQGITPQAAAEKLVASRLASARDSVDLAVGSSAR
jgi:glutamate dehydrogenase/leucine dehydrogenase